MRWPWSRRTDEELRALAVQIYAEIREACATCPSSRRDAVAVEVASRQVAAARLKPADEARLAATLGDLNDMLMHEALADQEPAGRA